MHVSAFKNNSFEKLLFIFNALDVCLSFREPHFLHCNIFFLIISLIRWISVHPDFLVNNINPDNISLTSN